MIIVRYSVHNSGWADQMAYITSNDIHDAVPSLLLLLLTGPLLKGLAVEPRMQ